MNVYFHGAKSNVGFTHIQAVRWSKLFVENR
jgi:hypothetical protein